MTRLPVQALNPEMSTESLTNMMTYQFVGSGRRQLRALREYWPGSRGGTLPACTSSCGRTPSCRRSRAAHPAAGEPGLHVQLQWLFSLHMQGIYGCTSWHCR